MHKYVQITILFLNSLLQRGILFVFPLYLARTTDEVYHICYISSHGDFLGVLRYTCVIFGSTCRSPTHEQCGEITVLYLFAIDIEILGVVDKYIYLLLF